MLNMIAALAQSVKDKKFNWAVLVLLILDVILQIGKLVIAVPTA